jgi:transcriptional regulator with XRE-family HTH domain
MAERGRSTKGAQPVDVYVGARIRFRRNLLGISQTEMGERIGVTFQQVQKYEKGVNRIGSSRLLQICEVIQVTPAWLFEGGPVPKLKASATAREMDAAFGLPRGRYGTEADSGVAAAAATTEATRDRRVAAVRRPDGLIRLRHKPN